MLIISSCVFITSLRWNYHILLRTNCSLSMLPYCQKTVKSKALFRFDWNFISLLYFIMNMKIYWVQWYLSSKLLRRIRKSRRCFPSLTKTPSIYSFFSTKYQHKYDRIKEVLLLLVGFGSFPQTTTDSSRVVVIF